MTHEAKIHPAQISILRELLFLPKASYSSLQKPTGLSSDHFSFHISRLVELGLVKKIERGMYTLSARGKEYANRLDTDRNMIEPQPKSAVLLVIRQNHGRLEKFLFQQRTKNPYYGFWGIPGGKIRWGETIIEAAARELREEAGLQADISFGGVYHEHVEDSDNGEFLEDKIFFVMNCLNPKGKLIKDYEGGHNAWFSVDEAQQLSPRYDSFDIELDMVLSEKIFLEKVQYYSSDKF